MEDLLEDDQLFAPGSRNRERASKVAAQGLEQTAIFLTSLAWRRLS